jgi:hypothetical protein
VDWQLQEAFAVVLAGFGALDPKIAPALMTCSVLPLCINAVARFTTPASASF